MNPNYKPKVSIFRASCALADMVELGWIRADAQWQVWDKEAGMWIDKYFEATEAFFEAVGVQASTVQKQQAQRLAWYQQMALDAGLSVEDVGRMSVSSVKKIRQQHWRQKAFERRAKAQAHKKLHRKLSYKSREEQRAVAQRRVLAIVDIDTTDLATFKALVNKELAFLREDYPITLKH